MKKTIFTFALALIAIVASAQRFAADNQRYLGYYSSDDVDNNVGLTSAPGKMQAGAYLQKSDYAQYVGAKVVGMRFSLGTDATSTGVTVHGVTSNNSYKQLVSVDVENEGPGWHTVLFDADKQFSITEDYKAYVPSFKYTQTRKNTPIGVYTAGPKRDLYIYGNVPTAAGGTGRQEWNNMGDSYGAVAVQLIVETSAVSDNALSPIDFGTYRVPLGQQKTVNVSFTNFGSTLTDFDYTIKINDQTSAAQHVTVGADQQGSGQTITLPIALPSTDVMGTFPVELTVTKVNGQDNQAVNKTAKGTCVTIYKEFEQRVFVEEMTGTGCGWCPRGMAGMELLAKTFGDRFVGVAIHRYNASTDPMAPREYLTLNNLPAGNAPLCIVNRQGQSFDPYYGTSGANFGSYNDILPFLSRTAELGVSVNGVWNEDQTEVTATALVESNISGDYDIAFILVGDSLVGDNAAWSQNNNYSQYQPGQGDAGNDENLLPYCSGGKWGANPIKNMPFNDVVVASSYSTSATLAHLDPVVAGSPVTASYTLKLPTKSSLKPYVKKEYVSVVAVVTDKSTGYVVNVAKNPNITTLAGIAAVGGNDAAEAVEVARYNAAGMQISAPQKGLNIVKYSNGKTVKVLVK